MRNILLAILVAVLPATSALAGPSGSQRPDQQTNPGRLLPVKRAGSGNSCAAHGPGFVKLEGTKTCVKIGGAVSIGVGGSSAGR
jgi:hypothetical protein